MRASEALVLFGFTALESEIYAFLLGENPATGYRVAKAIGKPAANTYKAVQSLERKGAITVDEQANRLCTPVAPAALIERLGKRFESNRKAALDALKKAAVAPTETARLTTIHGTAAALATSRAILEGAKGYVLLHAHPSLLPELAPSIEHALSEADVYILGEESTAIPGAEWIPARSTAPETFVLELAADTTSGLLAVGAGVGSELAGCAGVDHPFGAEVHRLLSAQMALSEIARKIAEDAGKKQIARILDSLDL